MNKTQKGFSAVETVMAIVIVGLLAALGWMYWTNVANKPKDDTSSSKVVSSVKESPSPLVVKKAYSSDQFKLAFDYPAGWSLTEKIKPQNSTSAEWDTVEIKSSDGFVITLTIVPSGVGFCCGPYQPRNIKDFKFLGDSQFEGVSVVSYVITVDSKETVVAELAEYKEIQGAIDDQFGANIVFNQAFPGVDRDKFQPGVPVAASFSGSGQPGATVNSKTLEEAIEVLKSLRKI